MKFIVKTHEIGLLFRHGSYIKAVSAGKHRYSALLHYSLVNVDMREKFAFKGMDISMFRHDAALMEMLHVVHVKDNEIALHYADGNFAGILAPGIHAYFKAMVEHTFKTVCTDDPVIAGDVDRAIFAKAYFKVAGAEYITAYVVPSGTSGILLIDGEYSGQLAAGTHYFWKGRHTVEVKTVDLRARVLEVSGQELLSQDKVTLRINFVCQYRVTDAVRAVTEFDHYNEQLYYALQMALREYVSTRKLDELLAEKHEIGRIILSAIQGRQAFFGAEFIEAGVKDIILPGDVRDILNTVLVAEKQALANVITRREETASTRSLLNTAKLMDENQTLYKLKELEYLERICDKVGSISISSGAGIIEQLGTLVGK